MSLKKRILIAIIILVVLAAAAVAGIIIWMKSPGIHIFGWFGNIDITEECYYFDENGRNGTASVRISGSVNTKKGIFKGTVSVEGDTELEARLEKIPGEGVDEFAFVSLDGDGEGYPDEYVLYYYGMMYEEKDGALMPHIDYEYLVRMNDNGDFILIASKDKGDGSFAHRFTLVNASDEKEAEEWFDISQGKTD